MLTTKETDNSVQAGYQTEPSEALTPGRWMRDAILEKRDDHAFAGLERWPQHFLTPDNDQGYGFLSMAIKHQRTQVVEKILSQCAPECLTQWNIQVDDQKKRLLAYAIEQPDTQLLSLLIDAGFDVTAVLDEERGGYALHIAAFSGKHQHLDLLCRNGAETHLKNNEGHTPWDVALLFHPSFALCLLQQYSKKDEQPDALRQLLSEPNRNFPNKPRFSKEEQNQYTDRCRIMVIEHTAAIENEQMALVQQMETPDDLEIARRCNRIGDLYFNQAWLIHLSQKDTVTPQELAAWEGAARYYNAAMAHQPENASDDRLLTLEVSVLYCVLNKPYRPQSYNPPQKLRSMAAEKIPKDGLQQNNQGMKSLWSSLLDETQAILGPSPCPFILVALGPLGRGEATSNAGIQWGIMLDKGHDAKRDHPYFVHLSQWLHLKILNLGQTPLVPDPIQPPKAKCSLTPQGLHIDDRTNYNPLGHPILGSHPVDETQQPRFIGSVDYWIQNFMGDLWNNKPKPWAYTLLSVSCLAASKTVNDADQWIDAYQDGPRSQLYPKKRGYFFRHKPTESLGKTWGLSMIQEHSRAEALTAGQSISECRQSWTSWVHGLALYYGIPQGNTCTELKALKQKKVITPEQYEQGVALWSKLVSPLTHESTLRCVQNEVLEYTRHEEKKPPQESSSKRIRIAATVLFVILASIWAISALIGSSFVLFTVVPPLTLYMILLVGMVISGIVMGVSDPIIYPDELKHPAATQKVTSFTMGPPQEHPDRTAGLFSEKTTKTATPVQKPESIDSPDT